MKRLFTSQVYFVIGMVLLVIAVITSAGEDSHIGVAAAGVSLGVVAGAFVLGAALFASRDR